MKIIKRIPALKTFDLPAGQYRATLTQTKPITKQTKRGPQEWVRLIFEAKVPTMPNQIPMAGRNFLLDLNPGSDLRNFLEVWLGAEFFEAMSDKDLDFDTLIGKEGIISLSHYLGDNYDKPHVNVDNMYPSNTPIQAEEKPKTVAPVLK